MIPATGSDQASSSGGLLLADTGTEFCSVSWLKRWAIGVAEVFPWVASMSPIILPVRAVRRKSEAYMLAKAQIRYSVIIMNKHSMIEMNIYLN